MSNLPTSNAWPKLLAMLLAVLTIAGCGGGDGYSGPTATVTGKVTYKGSPVPEGTSVTFIAEDGKPASGTTAADGSFALSFEGSKNIPVATYKVQLSPPAGAASEELMDPSKMVEGSKSTASAEAFPSKYAASSTSGLKFEIKEGENPPIEIDLK